MASVEKLPSGRYRGVYYLSERPGEPPRKRRVKGTFAHRRAAQRAAIEAEGRAIGDPQHDPNRGRMTWGSWERAWTPTRRLSPKTAQTAAGHVRNHIRPTWADVELVEITHHGVQVWVNDLATRLGPSTVAQSFHHLSASLRAALRAGHVRSNACAGVVLPTKPSAPERFLTDEEVDRLLVHFEGRYRVLVELLFETGMRLGEAMGLHWERVDLVARRVWVAEKWDPGEGDHGAIVGFTKGKAARTVPMTARLATVLEDWAERCPPRETCGLAHVGPACRSSLVVPSRSGGALDQSNFHARQWKRAVKLSGIGHVRPHDARHTWASRLTTAGVGLERLQMWGGWESYAMVQRYGRFMDDGAELYLDALDRRTAPKLRIVE